MRLQRILLQMMCYAGSFVLVKEWTPTFGDSVLLCHGVAYQADGVRIGHAWVERCGACIDHCEPRRLWAPAVYYDAGRVEYVVRYTLAQATALRSMENPYGPWDPVVASVAHIAVSADWLRG